MPQIEAVDVEGAIRAYITSYPGLTGTGNPLSGGVHLGKPRLPAEGAIGEMQIITPRRLDDIEDTARVSFRVTAVGEQGRAREVAERGCRALVEAIRALDGAPVTVTTRRGDEVKLLFGDDSSGPTFGGESGGSSTYLCDATFSLQPA
jgi:hypothetical protein